jgi:hypothetical protein
MFNHGSKIAKKRTGLFIPAKNQLYHHCHDDGPKDTDITLFVYVSAFNFQILHFRDKLAYTE